MILTSPDLSLFGIDVFFLLTLGIFALCTLIYVTGVFLIAQARQDNSVMDISYGPAFAVSTWATILLTNTLTPITIIVAILVTVWALRLGIRIGRKNWGKPEDQRYKNWRTKWMQRGWLYFLLRSYLQINILQGIIIVLVSLPMILVIAAEIAGPATSISILMYAGIGIWLLGLLLETTADWQLDQFIKRKIAGTEEKTLMTAGLFRYSRRPNYFGESLIWWGLAIIAFPFQYGFLALLSPLLITFILTKVTGPMLEDIFLEKYPEEYKKYMATTNYFIPWLPKKLSDS